MADVVVFKIQDLSEGGFVTYAPEYSQFSETLDLAQKRLIVQVESWAKEKTAEMRQAQAGVPINPQTPNRPKP